MRRLIAYPCPEHRVYIARPVRWPNVATDDDQVEYYTTWHPDWSKVRSL